MVKTLKLTMACCSLVFVFGCGWVGIMDNYSYNNPHQYACDKQLNEAIEREELIIEQQILGLNKEEVIAKLGKPKPKNIKFGYPYSVDRGCFGSACQAAVSDEAWYYEFEKKMSSCGRYAYSIIIYFVNGKVVRVG